MAKKTKFTTVKTDAEIKAMKEGGKILYNILHTVGAEAKEGVTMKELDLRVHELCKQYGVKPAFYKLYDFPGAICCSNNDEVVHGTPRDIPLKNMDIFTIDLGIEHKGLMTDSAHTFVIGGKCSKKVKKFLATVEKALYAAIDICKDGVTVREIGRVIERIIEKEGGYAVADDLGGHGIGYAVHEEPHIYNYEERSENSVLKKGMTIAIEPIANMGGLGKTTTDDDKWTIRTYDGSISCQFEHTVMIGEKRGVILTK
jgi:methionyl aminopeptidase